MILGRISMKKNPLGSEITGKVVNLTDFGIFIEVFDGVEGLVHISEVDSKIPKNKVHEKYPVGSDVQAKVIKIDLDERRLGLSITKVISSPEPAEKETVEVEKFTEGEKEKKDEKPVGSPEKAKEAAEVTKDSSSKVDNEEEAELKGKKKTTKKKVADDVKEEESIPKAEITVPEEGELKTEEYKTASETKTTGESEEEGVADKSVAPDKKLEKKTKEKEEGKLKTEEEQNTSESKTHTTKQETDSEEAETSEEGKELEK